MKIEKLELQAFGPFKDYEAIDFTAFDQNRIFLIGGKTGSGKTTIFDAISYALFGKMTGEFRDDSTARSQYTTSKDIETYVRLTFSKDNRRYEIYRKPAYMVEGRKTPTLLKICFKEITNGMDKVLSIKTSEANPMIVKLIGFKYEQFKQIVVLPQGEFIKILNAKSTEREELLAAILDTSLYGLMTDKLRDERNRLEAKMDKSKAITDEILLEHKVNNEEELKELVNKSISDFNEKGKEYKAKKKEADELSKRISEIDSNNKNLADLHSYEAKLSALYDNNKDIENDRLYLAKLRVINVLKGMYDGLISRAGEIYKYSLAINEAKEELKRLMPEYNNREDYLKRLNEASASLANNESIYKELNKYKDIENKLPALKESIDRLRKNKDALIKNRDMHKDMVAELTLREADFTKQRDENKKLIDSFDIDENNRISNLHDQYMTRLELENKLKQYQNEINEYENRLVSSKETLSNLENNKDRIEGIIKHNELLRFKGMLEADKPCPLCGSIHHPSPIEAPLELDYSIDSLNKEINKANININKLEAAIEANNKLILGVKADKYYSLDLNKLPEVEEAYNELEGKKITYFNRVNEGRKLDNLISEIKGKINLSTRLYNEAVSKLQALELDIQKQELDYDNDSKSLNSFLSGASLRDLEDDIRNEIKDLRELKLALDVKIRTIDNSYTRLNTTILELTNRNTELNGEMAKLNASLNSELSNNNLSIDEMKGELNNLFKIKELESRVSSFDLMRNDYNSKISIIRGLIKGDEIIDTASLKDKLNNDQELLKALENDYLALNSLKTRLEASLERYLNAKAAIKDDLDLFESYEYLYQLCSGKLSGMKKISIQKYVLMKLLDKILIYANHYLSLFSSHRYTLYREVNDSSSDKGLDLCVNDEHTGYMRAVSSLSGGESFMTALALALGTSECIMSMNGGIKMENIFIDEGFGTLDDEALNNAIEALVTLAQNGRLIGIISHVDSIKALIPEGIDVIKNKNGSKIELNI